MTGMGLSEQVFDWWVCTAQFQAHEKLAHTTSPVKHVYFRDYFSSTNLYLVFCLSLVWCTFVEWSHNILTDGIKAR